MDAIQLSELYNNNIDSVLNEDLMVYLANRKYDYIGYDLLNRILIYIQNKYVAEIRSSSGWELVGCLVKDKNSPIWALSLIERYKYVDTETGDEIDEKDLSSHEIYLALQLGLLKKEVATQDMKTVPLYSRGDTIVVNSDIYKEHIAHTRFQVKLTTLLSSIILKYGVVCVRSKESSYNSRTDRLHIGMDPIPNKLNAIADVIMHKLNIKQGLAEIAADGIISVSSASHMEKLMKTLITESMRSSLGNYNIKEREKFSDISKLDITNDTVVECLMSIMSIVYDEINDIYMSIRPSNTEFNSEIMSKAEVLLNLLESNDLRQTLKG